MEKPCVCGKKMLKNQPCWFEEGRCGLPCGKKLKCGVHECRKSCHKPGECEDAGISGSHCSQPCGKVRKSCEHTCADQCHAPYPCKEDKPCQSKTFITCPCQHRKQEVRCQATKLNPSTTRDSTLKCDDECLRLQRNRKLAEALDIDPSTHTDDHIPYSDTTLKRFRGNVTWAQEQERELRVFAAAPDEKRIRFKPMQSHQRAFLHALAEDFGLDSESQDPEPHRHVCIFKTPRFVSAPQKTLAQCLRIANTAAQLGAGASTLKPAPSQQHQQNQQPPFNALLLKDPRFGLTIDELDAALAPELTAASRSGGRPALTFTTSFLPSDEILIKATPPKLTAAAVATLSAASTPQAVETTLSRLKVAVARIVSRQGLAGAVALCHVDDASASSSSAEGSSITITRREGEKAANDGGWSAVASRGSWRRAAANNRGTTAAGAAGVGIGVSEQRAPSAFVALRRLEGRKKAVAAAVVEEKVEEDWLEAVENEEGEGKEEGKEEEKEEEEEEKEAGDGGVDDASGNEGVVSGEVDGVDGKEGTEHGDAKQEEANQEEVKHEETKQGQMGQDELKAHPTSIMPEGTVDF
jgi:transcriptional repressor NF-X1